MLLRIALLLDARLGRSGFAFFQSLRLAPFHRSVMRVGFFVVLAARAAEKEQNRLSVFGSHAASVHGWPVVVKRTTMPRGELSP
jgi:hypothetical protein